MKPRSLIRIHGNVLPSTVALTHRFEPRSVNRYLSARRMIYKLKHVRREPVACVERVKVNIERVIRSELANDFNFGHGWRRFSINIAYHLRDTEALRFQRSKNTNVIPKRDFDRHRTCLPPNVRDQRRRPVGAPLASNAIGTLPA